jgi:hypothetical protein
MPEAVIVTALRTPIGTADKGTNCVAAEAESASWPCARAVERDRPRSSRFRLPKP